MADIFKISYQNGVAKLAGGIGGVKLMKSSGVGNSPINLDTVAAYLRNYQTVASTSGGLRTPDFYNYVLDGNEYYISDGGNDMFDGSNYTAPALLDNTTYIGGQGGEIPTPPALSYGVTDMSLADNNFYYVSLGYGSNPDRRPLTMLGTRSGVGDPIGFQKAGNIGADNGGSIVYGNLYTGQVFNGFTTHAWYRQTYGQSSDPSICDLYILLGHPAWNSVFGTVENNLDTGTDYQGSQFRTYGASTQNVLAIATLLSRNSNVNPRQIPEEEIQIVVQNYTYLIGQSLGI